MVILKANFYMILTLRSAGNVMATAFLDAADLFLEEFLEHGYTINSAPSKSLKHLQRVLVLY